MGAQIINADKESGILHGKLLRYTGAGQIMFGTVYIFYTIAINSTDTGNVVRINATAGQEHASYSSLKPDYDMFWAQFEKHLQNY